jgi:very-short-patch-repair endonuclease
MAAFAGRQRGNVTRRQLLEHGVTPAKIRRRRAVGSLIERFPGVYLVGHEAEPPLSLEYAALLYCAPRALLSHRTAGFVHRLAVRRPPNVEVTTVGRQFKPTGNVTVYSLSSIEPVEIHRHGGMPITSPSLTLLDLASVVTEEVLATALNEARVKELVTDRDLRATLGSHPNRPGAAALARLLKRGESEFAVESEAERICLRLMIAHDLKPDRSRARIGPYRVDFLYEAERLVVEVDGFKFHRTKVRFVRDRRRRGDLMARGYEVFVVSWSDLVEEPGATMSRLRTVRARRRALALGEMGS